MSENIQFTSPPSEQEDYRSLPRRIVESRAAIAVGSFAAGAVVVVGLHGSPETGDKLHEVIPDTSQFGDVERMVPATAHEDVMTQTQLRVFRYMIENEVVPNRADIEQFGAVGGAEYHFSVEHGDSMVGVTFESDEDYDINELNQSGNLPPVGAMELSWWDNKTERDNVMHVGTSYHVGFEVRDEATERKVIPQATEFVEYFDDGIVGNSYSLSTYPEDITPQHRGYFIAVDKSPNSMPDNRPLALVESRSPDRVTVNQAQHLLRSSQIIDEMVATMLDPSAPFPDEEDFLN